MQPILLPKLSDEFSWRYDLLLPTLAKLPRPLAYQGAKWQSHFFAQRKKREADLIKQQMRSVFVEATDQELDNHLNDYFCMVEREALDTFFLNKSNTNQLVDLENFDQITAARKQGQNIILTGGHYGRFWMAGIAMRAAGHTTGTITRDGSNTNNHGLHPAEYKYRLKKLQLLQEALGGPFIIEGGNLRTLYTALSHHLITLIFDVPYVEKHIGSVTIPFLGGNIDIPSGIYRIAKKTNAQVAPFFMKEKNNGKLTAQFDTLLNPADYDEIGFMRLLANQLEKRILQRPGHWWLWEALPMLRTSQTDE